MSQTNRFCRALSCISLCLATFAPCHAALAAPAAAPHVVAIDRIVAVVNNEAITETDLKRRLKNVEANLARHGTKLPDEATLEKQLLDRMVLEKIELQTAKEDGIRVSDAEVEAALNGMMRDSHMTPEQFEKQVQKDGGNMTQMRADIHTELTINKLKRRVLAGRIRVTDSEINSLLQQESNHEELNSEFLLSHIFIRLPAEPTPAQIIERRARAEAALEALKQGKEFAQVAAAYSDAADGLTGGSLGWHKAAQLPELFLNALASMKPGDTSGILTSSGGYHIIRLDDRRGGEKAQIEVKTHVRHILIKTNDLVSDKEARDRLLKIRAQILAGSDFGEMAKRYSDDASAANGGDLGWIAPGDTVPEFEKAMDQLQPGEISQPVQTQFGWHLIQVLERKKVDVSNENKRERARQSIFDRKAEEAWNDWLREARDTAFVELRLDR